jgi:hypothetical protein
MQKDTTPQFVRRTFLTGLICRKFFFVGYLGYDLPLQFRVKEGERQWSASREPISRRISF